MTWACRFLLRGSSSTSTKTLGEEWKQEGETASQMQLSGAKSHQQGRMGRGMRCPPGGDIPGLTDNGIKWKSSLTAGSLSQITLLVSNRSPCYPEDCNVLLIYNKWPATRRLSLYQHRTQPPRRRARPMKWWLSIEDPLESGLPPPPLILSSSQQLSLSLWR